jgi:hypothetical protein
VSGLQRTGCLPSSLAERERGTKNIIHNISQRIYSVFCHAARLLHVPRHDKFHIPAHLMANCVKVCLRILLCIKFPLALAEIPSPLTQKTYAHEKNKYIVTTNTRKNVELTRCGYIWHYREKYCILNTTKSRLYHIKKPNLNPTQYQ